MSFIKEINYFFNGNTNFITQIVQWILRILVLNKIVYIQIDERFAACLKNILLTVIEVYFSQCISQK